jgi:hypothetical protein
MFCVTFLYFKIVLFVMNQSKVLQCIILKGKFGGPSFDDNLQHLYKIIHVSD